MSIDIQKKEVFISAQEYMGKFLLGLKEVIKWLHQGEELKALENMVLVVEGLEWISEALSLTTELHRETIQLEKINPLLMQLNDGLAQGDTVLVADILEYEIAPVVEEWNSKINVDNSLSSN